MIESHPFDLEVADGHSFCPGAAAVAPAPHEGLLLMGRFRRRWLIRGGLVIVSALVVATILVERGGSSAQPAGQLLPTPATVAHGQDVALTLCRRGVDGFADVEFTMTNPTATATDFGVTVIITSPTSGSSYDTVLAKYSLAPNQRLSVEASGQVAVPAALACQISLVDLERGA